MEPDALILVFWILSLNWAFSLSSFTSSRGSLVSLCLISSAYLRLLIFLLAVLIPAWDSSSLAFCMMYSAYKLNKQGNNTQPWHTLFPILNQSVSPCLVLTVGSWPAHRFLRRQIRQYSHLLNNSFFVLFCLNFVISFRFIGKMFSAKYHYIYFIMNNLGLRKITCPRIT